MGFALHAMAAPSAGSIVADVRRQSGLSLAASHSRVNMTGRINAKCSTVRPLAGAANQAQDGTINVEQPKDREHPGQRFKQSLLPHRRRRGDSPSLLLDTWDPFSAGSIRQMMDVIDGFFLDAAPAGRSVRGTSGRVLRTPWDVVEEEEAFYIRVDMPGFGKEDVKVTVEDGVLSIKGERDQEDQEDKTDDRWAAKAYRNFSTRLALPENIQLDKVTAELKNGVLNVMVPKIKPEDRKQVIDVQVG